MDTILRRPRVLSPSRARTARYVMVGAFGSALYYLILLILVETYQVRVLTATSIAFVIVVAANYGLHRMWTFRSKVAHRQAVLKFIGICVTGFFINSAVMALGQALALQYLLVQAVAIATVVSWNYYFTTSLFAQPSAKPGSTKGSSNDPI